MEFFYSDKLVVSTSCSLLHTAVDLVNEPKLDTEIKSWLAFAAQKVVEVDALAKALSGNKDEVDVNLVVYLSIALTYRGVELSQAVIAATQYSINSWLQFYSVSCYCTYR